MPRWINLPNLLTLLRLFLVPFVIQAILNGRHGVALALFAVAAGTDVLDGATARYLAVTTKVGAYLDPIADKCLLSGVFLALAYARIVPWWFVAIIFGRDLYLLAASGVVLCFTQLREFPPSLWGKLSTFVQVSTAAVWMARNALELRVLAGVSAAMLWASVVFALWSGLHYTWRGIQTLRTH